MSSLGPLDPRSFDRWRQSQPLPDELPPADLERARKAQRERWEGERRRYAALTPEQRAELDRISVPF